ncbi:hypothetical protein [Aquabacter spiritensis]|nr:hypothetical protein [Aquabacter spiritensis]
MAAPGSAAVVMYGDGCEVKVVPGAVVTIADESPCQSFAQAQVAPIVGATLPGSTVAGLTTATIVTTTVVGGLSIGALVVAGTQSPGKTFTNTLQVSP